MFYYHVINISKGIMDSSTLVVINEYIAQLKGKRGPVEKGLYPEVRFNLFTVSDYDSYQRNYCTYVLLYHSGFSSGLEHSLTLYHTFSFPCIPTITLTLSMWRQLLSCKIIINKI